MITDRQRGQEVLYDYTYNLKVFPSMRALYTAGPALDRPQCGAA